MILWQLGKGTVREVLGILRQRRRIAYTTVMTVMDNLFKKGYLERTKRGRAYCYIPRYTQEELAQRNVRQIVKTLLQEYQDLATIQFLKQSETLDPKLRKKLLNQLTDSDEQTLS